MPLDSAPDAVPPHHAVDHDYVVVSDRFGSADRVAQRRRPPSAAGGFAAHFAHMRAFWNAQLAGIAQISVPDRSLVDAYKSGFITTQITRSGNDLDTGVNGYESEFSHDVVGILTNLFTQGSYGDAHALLTEARNVVGAPGQYVDGLWTYSVPWAVYLLKTGDKAFVEQNFATGGSGAAEPSIEEAAHAIAADRTGPMGTMEATDDIDTQGYWTDDDFEALLGLAAYRYIASTLGDTAEASWASTQYASLLTATDAVLTQTISQDHLDYLPCSLLQPNTANRCTNPEDANWTSPIGNWAWEASLLGAPVSGPGLTMIDATYTYGFDRLRGLLPPDTTGGFPGDYYSSAYNAAQGAAGLASAHHQGPGHPELRVHDRQQSERAAVVVGELERPRPPLPLGGPAPVDGPGLVAPRLGHRRRRQGAARLPRGAAVERVVGDRPRRAAGWLDRGAPISVTNFPTTAGHRAGVSIASVRPLGLADLERGTPTGACPLPTAILRPQHCDHLGGERRPGHRDGDPGAAPPPRHGHPAPGALSTCNRNSPLRRGQSGPFGSCATGRPSLA